MNFQPPEYDDPRDDEQKMTDAAFSAIRAINGDLTHQEASAIIDAVLDAYTKSEPKSQTEWDRVYNLIRYWAGRARTAEAELASTASAPQEAQPEPQEAAEVKYVPVESGLRDTNYEHPNDNEPCTPECRKALNARGDDEGQGLDSFWKWGFKAGFNAASQQRALSEAQAHHILTAAQAYADQWAELQSVKPTTAKCSAKVIEYILSVSSGSKGGGE